MSKLEVSKLKSVRGSYKGHCTQDLKKAERLLAAEDIEPTELTAIHERLSRRLQEIASMDAEILMKLETPDEIERDTEEALSFQDNICLWILKISQSIEKTKPPVRQYHNSSVAEPKTSNIHINLPKINFKPFSGNPLQWQTFWECFRAAIHDNSNLSDIEKMTYLNGMLKEEAARALSGLPLTTENYAKGIELLKERFGRKQIQINAHMEALLNIPATSTNTINLREFYDICETSIRGLESLDVRTDTYGNLLIPILLKKLPEEITRLIFRANPSADSSVDELRTALRKEIETREKSYATTSSVKPSTSDEVLVPTAGALLTGATHTTQNYKSSFKAMACIYCKGTHRSDNCDILRTTEARKALLQRERRCYNCLRLKHMATQCYSKGRCLKCKRKHHTSICDGTQKNPSENNGLTAQTETRKRAAEIKPAQQASQSTNTANSGKAAQQTHSGTTYAVCSNNSILMQSAIVTAKGKNGQYQSRALFDTGSQRTFVTQRLKDKLNLRTLRKELLDITTFGSTVTNRKSLEVVSLNLSTNKEDIELTALVTPIICPPLPKTVKHIQIPLELNGLKLADPPNGTDGPNIDILIGNDHYGKLITGRIKKLQNESLIATETKIGWLLSGPVPKEQCSDSSTSTLLCQEAYTTSREETKLDQLLTKFWEISTIPEENDDTTEVYKTFEDTINFNETTGRYTVKLPWKDNRDDLSANYGLAKKRLTNLRYSLNKKNPDLINNYKGQLLDQLKQGFIETIDEPSIHTGTLHYIPHFPVFKEDSATTKMRIVYDASAKATPKALSLNDCLYTGPNLMQDLTTILLKFRTHQTAFTADIEKAFLQIEIDEGDRDATRFLWLKDVNKPANTPGNLSVYRFCRVLFGAAPSPFLLNATIQHHLNTKQSWISEDLKKSIYMDNVVSGTENETQALEYYTTSRDYFSEAGMNLRQWTSNSNTLNLKTHEDNTNAEKTVKVLGLIWNAQTDKLSLPCLTRLALLSPSP